jgi:MFS family permease
MTIASPQRPRRIGNLVAAMAAIGCCDIAFSLTMQLVPLLMEREHFHAWLIGLNAAMGPIGILLTGPWLPQLVSRFGSRRLATAAVLGLLALLFAFKLAPTPWVWFPVRFLFGICSGVLFTISEAWILTFAGDGQRGRIMGLFTSMLAITFSFGPLVVPLTGIEGWTPWLIGVGCIAAGLIPLGLVEVDDEHFREEEKGGYFRFFAKAPMLLVAVAAATLFDSTFLSFFTIYGLRHGLPLAEASRILGFAIIGNVLMFYPMGWLADHWSRIGVVVLTAVATVILSLLLIPTINSWFIWPIALLLTASAFGVYVISLALMGDSFKGADLVAGSAAFGAMWGVGGLGGPPLAGALIDGLGINALPFTLAGFYVVMLAALAMTGGVLVRGAADA